MTPARHRWLGQNPRSVKVALWVLDIVSTLGRAVREQGEKNFCDSVQPSLKNR